MSSFLIAAIISLPCMSFMAFQISEPMWALAIAQLALVAGGLFRLVQDAMAKKQLIQEREQDRLDRAQLASLTQQELANVKVHAEERLATLVGEIQAARELVAEGIQYSKVAIDTANNTNGKIAMLGEVIKQVAETPRDVHVVNTVDNPVFVEEGHR